MQLLSHCVMQFASYWEMPMVLCSWWVHERCKLGYAVVESHRVVWCYE